MRRRFGSSTAKAMGRSTKCEDRSLTVAARFEAPLLKHALGNHARLCPKTPGQPPTTMLTGRFSRKKSVVLQRLVYLKRILGQSLTHVVGIAIRDLTCHCLVDFPLCLVGFSGKRRGVSACGCSYRKSRVGSLQKRRAAPPKLWRGQGCRSEWKLGCVKVQSARREPRDDEVLGAARLS